MRVIHMFGNKNGLGDACPGGVRSGAADQLYGAKDDHRGDEPAPGTGILKVQAAFEDKFKGAGESHAGGACKNGSRKKGKER